MGSTSQATVQFSVIVIGAGIAGLATATCLAGKGHHVLIVERKPDLSEYGAGIQILPPAVRCLVGWGVTESIEKYNYKPECLKIKRYDTGEEIGTLFQNYKKEAVIKYGDEHWLMHRPDYQKVLAEAALRVGAKIEFNVRIAAIDPDEGRLVLEDGRSLQADLIVAADGIKSQARSFIPENTGIEPVLGPDIIYRSTVPRDKIISNPETAHPLDDQLSNAWLGPEKWILGYPIAKGGLYNLALMESRSKIDIPVGVNTPADIGEVRDLFKGFCTEVKSLLGLIDKSAIWPTAELPPLESWISGSGKLVLVGDAAHAMLPHTASGGSTAIEDAAALGECLSWCKNPSDLPQATLAWQAIRKPRCERIQNASRENAGSLALPDGAAQQARDQRFRNVTRMQEEEFALSEEERRARTKAEPDMMAPFGTPAFSQWLYSYDAILEANKYLAEFK